MSYQGISSTDEQGLEPAPPKQRLWQSTWNNNKGACLILLAELAGASMDAMARYLQQSATKFHPFQVRISFFLWSDETHNPTRSSWRGWVSHSSSAVYICGGRKCLTSHLVLAVYGAGYSFERYSALVGFIAYTVSHLPIVATKLILIIRLRTLSSACRGHSFPLFGSACHGMGMFSISWANIYP